MAFGNVQGQTWVRKDELNDYVPKSGATMTRPLTLAGSPTSSLMAANKGYVDKQIGNLTFGNLFVGSRNGDGSSRWNVNLPFTPKVFCITGCFYNGSNFYGVSAVWSEGSRLIVTPSNNSEWGEVTVSGNSLTVSKSARVPYNQLDWTYYYFALG